MLSITILLCMIEPYSIVGLSPRTFTIEKREEALENVKRIWQTYGHRLHGGRLEERLPVFGWLLSRKWPSKA